MSLQGKFFQGFFKSLKFLHSLVQDELDFLKMLFLACKFLIYIVQFSPCILEPGKQDISLEFDLLSLKNPAF